MADHPNDPKAPLRNLVLSCNADLIQLMARMGYPVRRHLQERVRNGLWHDDDCRRVGYKEELVKVGWKSGFMSRCEGCGQSLIFTKSFAFSCGHQFCKACSGKSIRRRYNPLLMWIESPYCLPCGPDFDRLWTILTYTPENREDQGVQWPEIVYSYQELEIHSDGFKDSVGTIVQASIDAFARIGFENIVAYALRKDAFGFQAFNYSHLNLARIVASQTSTSDNRKIFWLAVCVVRAFFLVSCLLTFGQFLTNRSPHYSTPQEQMLRCYTMRSARRFSPQKSCLIGI